MSELIDKFIDKVNEEQIKRGRPLALYELKAILKEIMYAQNDKKTDSHN